MTRQAVLNNLDGLSHALLAETRHFVPEAEKEAFNQTRGAAPGWRWLSTGAQSVPTLRQCHPFPQSKELSSPLGSTLPTLHQSCSHCPYAAVLSDHPEMCQIDSFGGPLFVSPIKQTARLQPNPQGLPQCFFSSKKL